MRILTNADAPAFISSVDKLLHERSRLILEELSLPVYVIYELYDTYRSLAKELPNGPSVAVCGAGEEVLYGRIFAGATIVYSELALRERICLPLPAGGDIPLVVDTTPVVAGFWCVATVHRNGINEAYFDALAQNTYLLYRAFMDA